MDTHIIVFLCQNINLRHFKWTPCQPAVEAPESVEGGSRGSLARALFAGRANLAAESRRVELLIYRCL